MMNLKTKLLLGITFFFVFASFHGQAFGQNIEESVVLAPDFGWNVEDICPGLVSKY